MSEKQEELSRVLLLDLGLLWLRRRWKWSIWLRGASLLSKRNEKLFHLLQIFPHWDGGNRILKILTDITKDGIGLRRWEIKTKERKGRRSNNWDKEKQEEVKTHLISNSKNGPLFILNMVLKEIPLRFTIKLWSWARVEKIKSHQPSPSLSPHARK